jgi:hypothetical protein
MHPYQQSTFLTSALVLASTVLVLAVSLSLITAALFMLTHLQLPQLVCPATF